ncbi:MAG TPA: hypothetical protein VMM92_01095 [Thermoanaerobaculia bacterium]|nr:hypothetical protein [Thermoanaerobaculia bacterium]
MTEEEIRARLRAEWEVIRASRNRLADLAAALPPAANEESEEELYGRLDLAAEVRAVLAIQMREGFKPLLKSLKAAAEYQPAGGGLRSGSEG